MLVLRYSIEVLQFGELVPASRTELLQPCACFISRECGGLAL